MSGIFGLRKNRKVKGKFSHNFHKKNKRKNVFRASKKNRKTLKMKERKIQRSTTSFVSRWFSSRKYFRFRHFQGFHLSCLSLEMRRSSRLERTLHSKSQWKQSRTQNFEPSRSKPEWKLFFLQIVDRTFFLQEIAEELEIWKNQCRISEENRLSGPSSNEIFSFRQIDFLLFFS